MIRTNRFRRTLLILLLSGLGPNADARDCGPAPEGFGPATRELPPGLENIEPRMFFKAPLGWIVAPTSAEASCAAVEMQAAAAAFFEHFGITPEPGVVLDTAHTNRIKALREGGMPWVMPWPLQSESAPAKPTPRTTAIRAQIEQQMAASGRQPDPEMIDRLVKQALDSLGQTDNDHGKALERTALRHELAHKLFIQFVWGAWDPSHGYGSGAPDWLDEIAAVSAESPQMTQSRRRHFAEQRAADRWIPLREFIEMQHPVYASPKMSAMLALAREEAQEKGASVMSGSMSDVPPDEADRAALFYSQSRSLLDYLKHRSQSPRILLAIAEALRGGESFSDWLATAGPGLGLPSDIDALERAWLAWAVDEPVPEEPASSE